LIASQTLEADSEKQFIAKAQARQNVLTVNNFLIFLIFISR